VTTTINVQLMRPTLSAPITPNPEALHSSPSRHGESISPINSSFTNNNNRNNANQEPTNNNNTVNTIAPPSQVTTRQQNNHTCHRKQYLISQFFDVTRKSSINTTTIQTRTPIEPTTNSNVIDTRPNLQQRNQKQYIQHHITKLPIANDYWGSSMDSTNPHHFRVFFQNINGLTAGKSMERWKETVTTMREKQCEIFGLAETNTNWNSNNIKNNISRIINHQFSNSSTILSSNRYNPNKKKRFLPGGTIQSCTNHWKSRCIMTISDFRNMGRWTGQKFQLKQHKTLTIITAYRPCKPNSTTTISTSSSTYKQQIIMLTEEGFSHPDPRKIFIDDMIQIINEQDKDNRNYTILMLDANENINDSEGGLSKLIQSTKLVDTFSHFGHEECKIPTYARGTKKIDYILTSASLIKYISNLGCLPFYMYNNSDHRGMFIEISESLIDDKIELKKPAQRYIGTNSPNYDIFKYKQYIDKHFKIHKIYDKIDTITSKEIPKKDLEIELNKLDQTITEIMLAAEKKGCRVHHNTHWSVELHISSIICNYWLKTYKGIKNNINTSAQTKRLYLSLPETIQQDIDLLVTNKSKTSLLRISKQQTRKHIQHKKELQLNHQELRRACLTNLKNHRLSQGDQKEADIIGKIATSEMRKSDWAKLRTVFNPQQRSGISNIEVPHKDATGKPTKDPDKAVTWKRIYDPKVIEDCLMERNINHFGQAEGTLFTRKDITQMYDYEGTSLNVTDLLDGKYKTGDIPNVTSSANKLLNNLSNKNNLTLFDNDISFQEFFTAFKKWNENTSTSPSGRHLGHYKCLLRPDYCDQLYNEQFCDPREKIFKVYYKMVKIASEHGISFKRWQYSTTAMIEKSPGCPKINKLRVIHLYEADYNIILKIIWARKLVWHVHDNNRINEGQAGSRPGFNAIDVIIQKEMKYLYSRLTKTNLATMDNDAKSCYDRIICNLAMIISQYYGVSRNMASLQATTLKKMKFRLRTALGESSRTYQHSNNTPIHGTGQGSCASPAIWLLISSILMDCLSEIGGGMIMQDVNGISSIQQWIDGFVDDTSLFTNVTCHNDNHCIIQSCNQLRSDMIIWNDLLEASGGKLELSKCFYYILSWQFDNDGNGIPMTIAEQRDQNVTPIQIKTTYQSEVTIQQKEVHQAHKTLGCYKAIDGNEKEQIQYLSNKSKQYGRKIHTAGLTRKQANMAYKMIYIPSMKYSLPACSLSEKEIDSIQNFTLDKFLPTMGFEHGSPRALIHGPLEMGGCEIPHLFTEMMGMKIETMISHIRADSILGKSIRININYLQLCSGLETPLFSSRDDIGYLPANWLTHLRHYIIAINGTFHIKNTWTPLKLRENDKILMTEFLKLGLSNNQLRKINNWRLYYQVNTLMEICNPEGTRIQNCFFKKPSSVNQPPVNSSNLKWPRQEIPGKKGFSLWLTCLRSCFNMDHSGRINHRFGKWLKYDALTTTNSWLLYIQPSSGTLFTKMDDSSNFTTLLPTTIRKNYAIYNSNDDSHLTQQLPHDCIPTNLRMNRKQGSLVATFNNPDLLEKTIMKHQPAWEDPFIENTTVSDTTNIHKLFSQDEFIVFIASDGGVYNHEGTFGIVISDGNAPLAHNNGKFYSVDFCESSFRSELYAMLAGILTFQSLCIHYKALPTAKITINMVSDCKTLVNKVNKRLNNRRTTNQHRDSDVDLELQLLHELQNLISNNMIISISHVRSHQELKKAKSILSHAESMNIMADKLTKTARKYRQKRTYTSLPQNPIDFTINKSTINSKYALRSKKAYHSISLRSYLKEKTNWSDNTIDTIWWQIYYNSLSKLSSPEKVVIYKFINDRLPTKAREQKYYPYRTKHCSQCQCDNENEDHIIQCFSIRRKQARKTWLDELEDYLSQNHTPPEVKITMMTQLNNWLEPTTTINNQSVEENPELLLATEQQQKIGWKHYIRGRMTIEWGNIIHRHIEKEKIINMTAEKWGANLLSIHWKHILKIWKERCEEIHGTTPEQIEQHKKERFLEEIKDLQSKNQNLAHTEHEWLLEDTNQLQNYNSNDLQTWIYEAKIISGINQQKIKHHTQQHRHLLLWNRARSKPVTAPIEKSDLDPGEHITEILSDC
jgi:hypothetical protein